MLEHWQNFYVIAGSAAGALTGLQFVVIALINETRTTSDMRQVRAFGTPTVVHFCAALLISAIASAPWQSLTAAAIAFGICGAAGTLYSLSVIRHAVRQTGYQPDAEDWFWYVALPLVAYVALVAAAGALSAYHGSLFVIAGVTLVLLFNGIHNAWDTVTYIAIVHAQRQRQSHPGD